MIGVLGRDFNAEPLSIYSATRPDVRLPLRLIRVALGADSRRIRTMVLVQGMTPALIGIAIGPAGPFGLAHLMTALLYGISPHDRVVFLSAPAVLVVVAFAAVWLPVRRAAMADPAITLRHD